MIRNLFRFLSFIFFVIITSGCPLQGDCPIGDFIPVSKSLIGHWEDFGEDYTSSLFISKLDSFNYSLKSYSLNNESHKYEWHDYVGALTVFEGDTILNVTGGEILGLCYATFRISRNNLHLSFFSEEVMPDF